MKMAMKIALAILLTTNLPITQEQSNANSPNNVGPYNPTSYETYNLDNPSTCTGVPRSVRSDRIFSITSSGNSQNTATPTSCQLTLTIDSAREPMVFKLTIVKSTIRDATVQFIIYDGEMSGRKLLGFNANQGPPTGAGYFLTATQVVTFQLTRRERDFNYDIEIVAEPIKGVGCNAAIPCSNSNEECTSGICQCRPGYTLRATLCTAVADASESHAIPIAAIALGISAGLVVILLVGIGIFIWRRRSQYEKETEHVEHEERSRVDGASNLNLHSDSHTNSEHENHPQPYWAVVTNARGEVSTAPEMDISMDFYDNISQSYHNRTENEAHIHPLEPEEHEGYIDLIHSNPMEHDGYIDLIHSEPAEHHVYIDPIP